MDYLIEQVLPHLAEYPVVLLPLYVLTLFYPRKASYFYGAILGILIVYGLYRFNSRFEQDLHTWLTTSDIGAWFYSFFGTQVPEESRDDAELAFTAGIYFMLKVCAFATLVAVPLAAKSRVQEAISNIGRRPAKDAPPVI